MARNPLRWLGARHHAGSNPLCWLGARYHAALRARPMLTTAGVGGSLAFAGDANAQSVEALQRDGGGGGATRFDVRRSAAFTSMSTFWTGGVNYHLYGALARWFPGGGWRSVLPKVAFNQLVLNPFVYLPCFFTYTGLVLGRTLDESLAKARCEFWSMLFSCWGTLGLANVFMFAWIPVRHQAVFIAFASFCFSFTASLLTNRDNTGMRQCLTPSGHALQISPAGPGLAMYTSTAWAGRCEDTRDGS